MTALRLSLALAAVAPVCRIRIRGRCPESSAGSPEPLPPGPHLSV
jgi:hypothetical protein